MRKILLLLSLLILISCSAKPNTNENSQLANPASVFCEEHGGTVRIEETPEGQRGICVSPEGKECDEWALYRGECPLKIPEQTGKPEPSKVIQNWKYVGMAVSGAYADADIIEIEPGKYRLYYAAEPEVPGFKGQIYSSISTDGINWNKEDGERMQWATFPSVIKIDGKYRMYYQNAGVIKSSTSSDGLSWNQESGTRMDSSNNVGLTFENVAAPTIIKSGDEYIMVYRGTINEQYSAEKVPNKDTQIFLWAASKDGLTFEKKGIALDSRNSEFKGLLDGPEFVQWDDGSIRLYFWSYKGVYHTLFSNNAFSQTPEFDYTTATDPNVPFAPNPPCDPTILKVNNKWLLYYGIHTEGIKYAEQLS